MPIVRLPTSEASRYAHTFMQCDRVNARLKRLPPRLRKPLVFVMMNGLSYEEAAGRLKTSVAKVKERLDPARAQIAKMIEEENAIQCPDGGDLSKYVVALPFTPPVEHTD